VGFGWGGWWNPWWWGGPSYAWYNPYWYGVPYAYPATPSTDYGPPYAPPADQPSDDDSLYGPYYGGVPSDNDGGATAGGYVDNNPPTANVAESVPTILLYLKDGTMLVASDYWVVDGQLHYVVRYGSENTISMSQVDLRRTTDENAKRGVHFNLKSSPALDPNGVAKNRDGAAGFDFAKAAWTPAPAGA
jgi:hypothetical protein